MKKIIFSMIVCTIVLGSSLPTHAQCLCNLIVNGDFEAGNTGFSSEYTYQTPPEPPTLHPDGLYTVYTNPKLVHSNFTSYGDHTSGAGNMLIVNAAADSGEGPTSGAHIVWQQTVDVIPNTEYVFTYWLSSCRPEAPANMKCSINGTPIGTQLAPSTAGIWAEVSHSWNSASNTSATITLEDLTRVYSGDDFAIDDISLCAPAQVFDLCAGQSDDIGEVEVWNDGDYIYVEFVTDEVLLETHVHVAATLQGIPQTKKFNPIPGQFGSAIYYPDEHLHKIPLDPAWVGEIVVAAHAATGVKETMFVFSDGSETYTAYSGPGTSEVGCMCAGIPSPRSGTAVLAWTHPAWASVTSQFTMGTWIWEFYRSVNPVCGDIVDFQKTFTIPGYPDAGRLWITADNGYEAYLNNTLLGSDGLSGDWRNSDLKESFVTTAQAAWSSIEDYDLIDWLQEGANSFRFETANEYFCMDDGHGSPGTVDSNPGGLIYEAGIDYYIDGETAWGDGCSGTSFLSRNWGTYFNYTVNECQ